MPDYVQLVKNALTSSPSAIDELRKNMHEDATFNIPDNLFRIEGVAAYADATRAFEEENGLLRSIDLRQPRVDELGSDAALVTFHVVSRFVLGGSTGTATAAGTAVISGGKIKHLHLSS